MTLTIEQFKALSDIEQLQTIKALNDTEQVETIIDVLTSVGTENLSISLLGELVELITIMAMKKRQLRY